MKSRFSFKSSMSKNNFQTMLKALENKFEIHVE